MANRILTRAAISIRSRTFVAAALFGLTLLGANYKLTLGVAAPKWDADMLFAPYQMLLADHARAGKFLLWDPWLNGGSPDYAEPQVVSDLRRVLWRDTGVHGTVRAPEPRDRGYFKR